MKKIIIITFLLLVNMFLLADIVLNHTAPFVGYKESLFEFELNVDGDYELIQEVKVMYRERGEVAYSILELNRSQDDLFSYTEQVTLSNKAKGLEYYFEVVTIDEIVLTYPENQPTLNPILVQIINKEIDKNFILLTEDLVVEEGETFNLSVSIYPIAEKLDIRTIKVLNGNVDVTLDAIISNTLIVYTVDDMKKSTSLQITGKDKNGNDIHSDVWNITVKKRLFSYNLPLNMRGNVNFKSNLNDVSVRESSQTESSRNSATTQLNLRANYKAVKFKSKFLLSSLESSKKQAVNRYSIEFDVPYFDLYLGDRVPFYSEYTLAGKNVHGVGSRVHFEYLSLASFWGHSARSVSSDISDTDVDPGTFRRNTLALKLLFGNADTSYLGFNFVKNKDKISTLDEDDYLLKTDTEDELLQIINPKDNVVISTDIKLASPTNNLVFGSEMAISGFNQNTLGGAISADSLEDALGEEVFLDPDDIDHIFIINKNVEPLKLTTANVAMKMYVNTYFFGNYFTMNFSRVGSAFKSLSSNNLNSDSQTFSISDNMNFHNVILIDFGFNRVTDNLSDNKLLTNEFSTYFLNSIFRYKHYPMLRFGLVNGRNSLSYNEDIEQNQTAPLDNIVTRNLSLGIGYSLKTIKVFPFSIDIDYLNKVDEEDENNSSLIENDSYNVRFKTDFKFIPLHLDFNYNIAQSTSEMSGLEIDLDRSIITEFDAKSFRIRLAYDLWENRIRPYIDYKKVQNDYVSEDGLDVDYKYTTFGCVVNPHKLTSVSTSLRWKDIDYAMTEGNRDYKTFNWYLNIVQKF